MVLFDYEDYILRKILTSKPAKNILSGFFMTCTTNIIKFHLSLVLSLLFSVNYYLDLVIPIGIGIALSLLSKTLYNYVETHRLWYDNYAEYFIDNYSISNAIVWKRYILLIICCYILLTISIVEINNNLIFVSLMQFIITFVFCDIIDNNHGHFIVNKILDMLIVPKVNIIHENSLIIEEYKKLEKVQEIPEKPMTPPKIIKYI